jgi:hypothetical protein
MRHLCAGTAAVGTAAGHRRQGRRMTDGARALASARSVILVDWPSADVPRSLLAAGKEVTSVNRLRGTAMTYSLRDPATAVDDDEGSTDFGPADDDPRRLVGRPSGASPERADALCAYRPAGELAAIARLAVDLGARLLWMERGVRSEEARAVAEAAGLTVVEDASIADAARALGTA